MKKWRTWLTREIVSEGLQRSPLSPNFNVEGTWNLVWMIGLFAEIISQVQERLCAEIVPFKCCQHWNWGRGEYDPLHSLPAFEPQCARWLSSWTWIFTCEIISVNCLKLRNYFGRKAKSSRSMRGTFLYTGWPTQHQISIVESLRTNKVPSYFKACTRSISGAWL